MMAGAAGPAWAGTLPTSVHSAPLAPAAQLPVRPADPASSVPATASVAATASVPPRADPLAPATATAGQGSGPSQQYLDAMTHAADRPHLLAFRAATVPLRPRLSPTAPSAGRASVQDVAPAHLAAAMQLQAEVTPTGLRREVLGFLPYWELGSADLALNWSVLSTIAYFGLAANADGTLVTTDGGWTGWRSGNLSDVIDQAHQHGTKVLVSVERFGWTSAQLSAERALLASPSARSTMVAQIVSAVTSRGVDGVNLDFEPIPSGQSANFVALVRQLRAALTAAGPGYSLVFDSTAGADGYDIAALTAPGAADAVFIMGYDFRGSGAGRAGSVDPLGGPAYDLRDSVTRFLGLTDPSHVILGLPYYGRAWTTTSNAPNAITVKDEHSVAVDYTDAVALAAQYGRNWDATEMTPWVAYRRSLCAGCSPVWRELYYDDAQSLGLRFDLVNRMNLLGAGVWTLGKDGSLPELSATLAAKFLSDTTPPDAGILVLPESVDTPSIPVSWTAVDDWSGVRNYDVQVSVDGGAWGAWLTGVTQTSGTYAAQSGHGYAFRVRATDGRGNVGPWDVSSVWAPSPALASGGFARVIQGPLNMRASASVTAPVVGQLQAGQVVAITGGPVAGSDGFTWYQATAPVAEWNPVGLVHTGVWVAGSGNGQQYLAPRQAPNAVTVYAELGSLAITPVDSPGGSPSARPADLPLGFSPNGDGRADALRIAYHVRNPLNSLQLQVFRAADLAPLGSVQLPGISAGDQAFDWDGRINGQPVPDGAVYLVLAGQAGGTTCYAPGSDLKDPAVQSASKVVVATAPPTMSAPVLASPAFSPNGDGSRDSDGVTARGGPGVVSWTVAALGASGQVLRSWSGAGPAISASWDGTDGSGNRQPDGGYTLRVTVADGYGNIATSDVPVTIDTVPVTGGLVVAATNPSGGAANLLSPNGDGVGDTITFTWSPSVPVRGTITIQSGATVRWSAPPGGTAPPGGSATWNGLDAAGRPVPDGTYVVAVTASDPAGNLFAPTARVVVDRIVRSLVASPNRFYPQDGDALARTARVSFVLARAGTTTLRVLDASGRVVRTAWSGRRTPAGTPTWTFDGRDGTGKWLPQGAYTIQVVATDRVGKAVISTPITVGAFMVRTSVTGAGADATCVVDAWSSEPLRAAPTITLTLPGGATLAGSVVALGGGHVRATFAGAALTGTATVTLVGVDTAGRANRYAYPVAFP